MVPHTSFAIQGSVIHSTWIKSPVVYPIRKSGHGRRRRNDQLQCRQRHGLRKHKLYLRPVDTHAIGLDIGEPEAISDAHPVYPALRWGLFQPDAGLDILLCEKARAPEEFGATLVCACIKGVPLQRADQAVMSGVRRRLEGRLEEPDPRETSEAGRDGGQPGDGLDECREAGAFCKRNRLEVDGGEYAHLDRVWAVERGREDELSQFTRETPV